MESSGDSQGYARVRYHGMRTSSTIILSVPDRQRLEAIVRDRNTPQGQVTRARIILATDNGLGTNAIVRELGTTKNTVWRWRDRFHEQGVDSLLRDKTRPPRIPPIEAGEVQTVIDLTLGPAPGEATHWTGRAMVEASGLSLSSIQRIWRAHGLAPHRWRQFKLSRDPAFAEKLQDIVGLYVDPPAHAVVLSIDEKSQIQALDRTQPGLPMKPGRCGTMTHDYKRHGTTTLFAALNILDGTVIGRNMQRHRHQEFIRFLNEIDRIVPASRTIHAIVDNYATHKHKRRCGRGWPGILAGPSTSRQPRAPGSTQWRASLPS